MITTEPHPAAAALDDDALDEVQGGKVLVRLRNAGHFKAATSGDDTGTDDGTMAGG